VDRRSRQNYRGQKSWVPNVGINPLGGLTGEADITLPIPGSPVGPSAGLIASYDASKGVTGVEVGLGIGAHFGGTGQITKVLSFRQTAGFVADAILGLFEYPEPLADEDKQDDEVGSGTENDERGTDRSAGGNLENIE
jgi:hypothetical protein